MTQKDVVTVCVGGNNVSKNVLNKGLKHIIKFMQNRRNTNVITMNVPHRFDLE